MGTVVIGKIESGSVCKGSQFLMMPNRVSWIIEEEMQEGWIDRHIDIFVIHLEYDRSPFCNTC